MLCSDVNIKPQRRRSGAVLRLARGGTETGGAEPAVGLGAGEGDQLIRSLSPLMAHGVTLLGYDSMQASG